MSIKESVENLGFKYIPNDKYSENKLFLNSSFDIKKEDKSNYEIKPK